MAVTSTSITLLEGVMSENLCSALEAIVWSNSDALSYVWMVLETFFCTLIYGDACGSSCYSSRVVHSPLSYHPWKSNYWGCLYQMVDWAHYLLEEISIL